MPKGESQNLNQSETISIVICLKEQEYHAKTTERIQKMRRKKTEWKGLQNSGDIQCCRAN